MGLNANALTTVAQAKEYLKLDGTSDVALLESIINGVAELFERYTRTKFINSTVTEKIDGTGADKLTVEYCPISALTSITIDGTLQTITNFAFNARAGIIKSNNWGVFPEGFQNIEIVYVCGYGAAMANMPADVLLAALKQAEYFYKRDSADFSQTFEAGLVLKAPSELLSPTVRDMLSPYFRNPGF